MAAALDIIKSEMMLLINEDQKTELLKLNNMEDIMQFFVTTLKDEDQFVLQNNLIDKFRKGETIVDTQSQRKAKLPKFESLKDPEDLAHV